MSNPTKSKRKLTVLELPTKARGALRRLKVKHGLSFTASTTRGVIELEQKLNQGGPQ